MKIKKIIFVILLVGILLIIPGPGELQTMAAKVKPRLTIVVDAGHGEPDGGAEGGDGTREAELNLAIAKTLEKQASQQGIKVIMTRETESGLYVGENVEKKWRKLEDLSQRKQLINESKADLAITIHMNSFPSDQSVCGAQVFYPKSGNAEVLRCSEVLAKEVQESLIKGLDDGTNRVHMAKGDVLLLENPPIPTILVECGFLSNPSDLSKLKDETWQKKIAACILEGVEASLNIN